MSVTDAHEIVKNGVDDSCETKNVGDCSRGLLARVKVDILKPNARTMKIKVDAAKSSY